MTRLVPTTPRRNVLRSFPIKEVAEDSTRVGLRNPSLDKTRAAGL